jgi:hypothetical protein
MEPTMKDVGELKVLEKSHGLALAINTSRHRSRQRADLWTGASGSALPEFALNGFRRDEDR